jgi:hypothetical protein
MTIPSGAESVTKMTPVVKPMRKMVMTIAPLPVLSVVLRRPRQFVVIEKADRLIFQGWRDCIVGDVGFRTSARFFDVTRIGACGRH